MGEGEARLALGSLFYRTLRLQDVEVDNMTAGVRDRNALVSASAAGPAATGGC